MTTHVLSELLRQGRGIDAWSRILCLLAGAVLILPLAGLPVGPMVRGLAALSLALGILQAWLSIRTAFDAAIFARMAEEATSPSTWSEFDRSLAELKLRAAAASAPRDVVARGRGALRLLRLQTSTFLAQSATLLLCTLGG
jgi:hypothetical protein